MNVKHYFTNQAESLLDFLEEWCILRGISYVRIESEIHFLNTILFFHSKEEIRFWLFSSFLEKAEVNPFLEDFEEYSVSNDFKENVSNRFVDYKKKMYDVDTKGYPNKRIRKRF